MQQVRDSPDIDLDLPGSRQAEAELNELHRREHCGLKRRFCRVDGIRDEIGLAMIDQFGSALSVVNRLSLQPKKWPAITFDSEDHASGDRTGGE